MALRSPAPVPFSRSTRTQSLPLATSRGRTSSFLILMLTFMSKKPQTNNQQRREEAEAFPSSAVPSSFFSSYFPPSFFLPLPVEMWLLQHDQQKAAILMCEAVEILNTCFKNNNNKKKKSGGRKRPPCCPASPEHLFLPAP